MKIALSTKIFVCLLTLSLGISVYGQKTVKNKPAAKQKTIVFAVLNDGKSIEPIGEINKDELVNAIDGEDETQSLVNFSRTYYKPKTVLNLIFGAAKNGTVTIQSSDPKAECSKNAATVTTVSAKAKLKNLVMGLATNQTVATSASGVRRLPTPAERAEIETLVRAEFAKQSVSAEAIKAMKYHNLTALDIDNDQTPEFVGTFWAENSPAEQNHLFFIAEKAKNGKYAFGYNEYAKVTPEQVMSGELKDLANGIGHELLLDALDYNGDGTAEIFTVGMAFEGYNYYVYSRRGGKWTRVFETYNYHCAF